MQNEKYEDIICWTRSGEGFIVKKVKEFADTVLPIFFRHSNYTSFVRQVLLSLGSSTCMTFIRRVSKITRTHSKISCSVEAASILDVI